MAYALVPLPDVAPGERIPDGYTLEVAGETRDVTWLVDTGHAVARAPREASINPDSVTRDG